MPRYFDPLLKLIARATEPQLAAQIQFLKAENRMLRSRLPKIVRLSPGERQRLLDLGQVLRWSVLRSLISVVHPHTFARWVHRYKSSGYPGGYDRRGTKVGRPRIPDHVRELVIRVARETGLGYTRIQGELRKLGIELSRSTITNILKGVGMSPNPTRGEGRWDEFLAMHAKTLWACDFLTVNALTARGIRQFYMILFIHVASRRMVVSPATMHPTQVWVAQQARTFTMSLGPGEVTHLLRDRDHKFLPDWDGIIEGRGIESKRLPRHSPNLNAFAERAIQTLKQECLEHFVICGGRHLDYLVQEFVEYYNRCRPHSRRGGLPPVRHGPRSTTGEICCETRLGGLLRHYYRKAA